LVQDGVTGFLVPPKSERAWETAIQSLQSDDISQTLGAAAYSFWMERYAPDVSLAALLDIYDKGRRVFGCV
jgi:glycosyltransferase involved in cell wall biosynthesis